MPAWKDQLDWGPPEGEVSSSQPQPGQHADSPGSVTPAPAKQSLAGLLAGQQPSQISNKNAVPSWTDQIDWDTEDPSEPSGGAPVPSHEPSLKSGVSLGDFVSSAQAASEQEQGRSDESAILNFSNTNAVPTWKDQLDWGSPPEGETDDAADAPEPWLSQGFIDGLEESTAQVKPSTADGAVPEGQIDQTFSALEPESIVNPGAEPESEPWQSIETPSPVLSAPIAAQPAEPLPAFDQMAQAFEHLQAALAPPRDPAEAANADASVGEVQEKSPSFQGFPGIGQKTLENILAVPAIEGGFFAHLADKTDIFDGSSMPHSGAFGAIDSVSIDDPDPIEEREQHDPGESREEQDEQSTSESDTGKQTGEFEDGSEGADAEGVSRSKRRRTKEKRRKKK
jgi:hypothetical protein